MSNHEIFVDPLKCIACQACVKECPAMVYGLAADGKAVAENPRKCVTCGHCVAVCPTDAISHSAFPSSSLFSAENKPQPDVQLVLDWLQTRRSPRTFQRLPVRKDLVNLAVKAARSAPLAAGINTNHITVVQNTDVLAQISELTVFHFANLATMLRNRLLRKFSFMIKAYDNSLGMKHLSTMDQMVEGLKAGTDPILYHAPCLFLIHGNPQVTFALENAQLAIENASLMFHAVGLASFYCGYVILAAQENKTIARLLNIPDEHRILAGLAVGTPEFKYLKGIRHPDPPINWV